MPTVPVSRRGLLASASSMVLAGGALGETIQRYPNAQPERNDRPPAADPLMGYLFFTAAEAAFIEAAVARLIPNDDLGAGAYEAGVAVFIDRQLAGPYGQGDHFYLKGPFPHAEPTQGWQMRKPADVYRDAVAEIDRYAADAHGAAFATLAVEKQDEVLKALESGGAKLRGAVESKAFFTLLLQNAQEGFFADPLYGGNRGMAGWKLIGFPGARYNNRFFVTHHGERYPLPPVSLSGRPDWTRS